MCFLTYFCEAQNTKILRQQHVLLKNKAIQDDLIRKHPLTAVEAMRELTEVRAISVRIKGNLVWVRNDIKGNAAQLFTAIGVPIPPKLLKGVEGGGE